MKPLGQGDPLRLGPYRLHGVLGEGGMGKVYFGADASGGPAAVKVLLPELAHDGHLAERFLREARTAQAVTSEGVARVLAAELEGGRPWIATEFLVSPTLDDAVGRFGPLDDAAVRELARSLARTLQDVHATGLVHRDVKPPNVVLTSRGPRLIDFGIARPEHGLTLTRTGQIPVTPGYGAPEQVLGKRVGPAADVFSLGAVLAFAAGGQPHVHRRRGHGRPLRSRARRPRSGRRPGGLAVPPHALLLQGPGGTPAAQPGRRGRSAAPAVRTAVEVRPSWAGRSGNGRRQHAA